MPPPSRKMLHLRNWHPALPSVYAHAAENIGQLRGPACCGNGEANPSSCFPLDWGTVAGYELSAFLQLPKGDRMKKLWAAGAVTAMCVAGAVPAAEPAASTQSSQPGVGLEHLTIDMP